MTPEMTAADRALAQAIIEAGCKYCGWAVGACHLCEGTIATALTTVRAKGEVKHNNLAYYAERLRNEKDRRIEALENTVENWKREAMRAVEVADKYMTRVTALEEQNEAYRIALIADGQRVEALEAALQSLEEAWSLSWDCSADPGHRIMNVAWDALTPGAGGT